MKCMCVPLAALLLSGAAGLEAQTTLKAAVNAASYLNPSLPNGNLTEGGVFVAFGTGMGPAKLAEIGGFPLPTTLAGTSISATVGGTTVKCIMLYTSATQVAAVLPSSTPVGSGTLVLTYNGDSSAPLNITVVEHDFGIFAVNEGGSGPGVLTNAITNVVNSSAAAANAGELVDIWGTGLGPVAGNEADGPLPGNIPNLPLQVFVGGQQAQVNYAGRSGCCTGLDQIEIVVPAGITGCTVPVYLVVGGVVSNFVTMSIAQTGSTCTNPSALTPSQLQTAQANGGLRTGAATLSRFHNFAGTVTYEGDTAGVAFSKVPLADLNPPGFQLPAANTCYVSQFPVSLGAAGALPTALQAGGVTMTGPIGMYTLVEPQPGDYEIVFSPSSPSSPGIVNNGTVLEPGSYTFNVAAGHDITSAFSTLITLPAALQWTNRPNVPATISRSQPLTVNWTNGFPGALVTINAQSSASLGVGAAFTCWADATAGTFTVPVAILAAMPPTFSADGVPQGALNVYQVYNGPQFTAAGIDEGTTSFADGYLIGPVTFQ